MTRPTNAPIRYSISISEYAHTPPHIPAKAADALREKKLRFGSKRDPPLELLPTVGETRWMRYCEASKTVMLISKDAKTEGMDSGGGTVLDRGYDFWEGPRPSDSSLISQKVEGINEDTWNRQTLFNTVGAS